LGDFGDEKIEGSPFADLQQDPDALCPTPRGVSQAGGFAIKDQNGFRSNGTTGMMWLHLARFI
jgi:hypothetical protein